MSYNTSRARYHFSLLHAKPLVTFSSFELKKPHLINLFRRNRELFNTEPGLHLLSATWHYEQQAADLLKRNIEEMHQHFPEQRFIFTVSNEVEGYKLSSKGIPNILCNSSMFQDEGKWRPTTEGYSDIPGSDALYIARLSPFKRHELCAQLTRPLFVYGRPFSDIDADIAKVKESCPDAVFVNHILGGGKFRMLDEEEICRVASHAKVSLCLSRAEGTMRSCMQSLMCGLPVLSTPSIGGRDRYLNEENSLVVPSRSNAVRKGVQKLIDRNLSSEKVRSATLKMVDFDRRNFVHSFNRLAKEHFDDPNVRIELAALIGARFRRLPENEVLEQLVNAMGITQAGMQTH